ncbi:MAG: NUDIX hydrolase [Planctomycetota bacterium]
MPDEPNPADPQRREIGRTVIHKGAKFDFEQLTLTTPSGRTITREVVNHPGAVCILPILETAEGPKIVLIRNDRFALGETLWELPAGTREVGEEPIVTAARELEEETGYVGATIEPLGWFYTTPGMTNEAMHCYLATGLSASEQQLEADERITVHPTPLNQALKMLDDQEIRDGKAIVTFHLALRQGKLPGVSSA